MTCSERFWSRVDTSGDCWVWTGARHPLGAGQVRWGGRAVYAHRLAFELTFGPEHGPIHRLASCDRACVRPHHLRRGLPHAVTTKPLAERFWSKVDKSAGPHGCWPWTASVNHKGYGSIKVRGRTNATAHRVAYELTHGSIPDGMFVCHHCDNPPCCNPAHLYAGTRRENARDAIERGRLRGASLPGELHPMARLTWAVVREIRTRPAPARVLAAEYGVSQSTIHGIRAGRRWIEG